MNKDKLKEFVNALDSLSDDVKDWGVTMSSTNKPACGTPGCHEGLVSIVAENLPELQEIYKRIFFSLWNIRSSRYECDAWADTLAEFLGFVDMHRLTDWAKDNPKLWGNKRGYHMFCSKLAFTDDLFKKLTHRDIINHWKQVLKNIEA
ncbi:hypothetical protein [uncultured Gammaproteobacteria bacterium]|nr:hypothetical protein [uncultured Gammaproteobacteria bacterium]